VFGRTFERIGLVALGALASAGLLTLADNDGGDQLATSEVAAGIAVTPGIFDSRSDAETSADVETESTVADARPSRPPVTLLDPADSADSADSADPADPGAAGGSAGGSSSGRVDGDAAPGANSTGPAADVANGEARVASASAGAVSSLVVELAPANHVFGTTTTAPATTTTTTSTIVTAPVTPPADVVSATTVVLPRADGRIVEGAEWRLLNGINALRNRSGVNGISMDEVARTEARRWSREMADRNYFDHRPDISSGVPNSIIGENVATGGDITAIHDGLWNSQSHRDNILSVNYAEVGIGVWYDGRTGQFWVTEIFIG